MNTILIVFLANLSFVFFLKYRLYKKSYKGWKENSEQWKELCQKAVKQRDTFSIESRKMMAFLITLLLEKVCGEEFDYLVQFSEEKLIIKLGKEEELQVIDSTAFLKDPVATFEQFKMQWRANEN